MQRASLRRPPTRQRFASRSGTDLSALNKHTQRLCKPSKNQHLRAAPGELVLDDLVTRATPGLHTHIGRQFYGWVAGASHPVGVAADWLASTWGRWSKRNPRTSGGARGLHFQRRQACQSTVGVAYPLQTRSQPKDRKSNQSGSSPLLVARADGVIIAVWLRGPPRGASPRSICWEALIESL